MSPVGIFVAFWLVPKQQLKIDLRLLL